MHPPENGGRAAPRHIRVAENHVRVDKIFRIVITQLEFYRKAFKLFQGRRKLLRVLEVRNGHLRAGLNQEQGVQKTAAQQSQAHDRDSLAFE